MTATVLASDISRLLLLSSRDSFGVANDQLVITAVAGSRLRICGWIAQGTTAGISTMALKNGSGGSGLIALLSVPPKTNGLSDKLLIFDSGYFETSTGVGVYVDVTDAALALTLFYKVYVP